MENQKVIIIRSTYTEAQKKAIKKYKETHPEKMSEIYKKNYVKYQQNEEYKRKHRIKARQRYQDKKDDPEFMALMRIRNKEYYLKRKLKKQENKNNIDDLNIDIIEKPINNIDIDIIEKPVQDILRNDN